MAQSSPNMAPAFSRAAVKSDLVEGHSRTRHVILEFPDYEAAVACYQSDEYREILKLRVAASDADIVIVEGYDGPQPNSH